MPGFFGVLMLGSFLFLDAQEVSAATITVNSLGNSGGAGCELREAIVAANTNATSGGCTAGSGASDLINFSVTGTIDISGADLPTLTSEIDISGGTVGNNNDINITIDAEQTASRRIFTFTAASGVRVDLNNLHLKGGRQTDGGCISLTAANLTLVTQTMIYEDCVASGNGGVVYAVGGGGGIGGGVSIIDSQTFDNSAGGDGGVIWAGRNLNIGIHSGDVDRNTAFRGAVLFASSTLADANTNFTATIQDFSSNTSTLAGALFLHNVGSSFSQVNFLNNYAGDEGGSQIGYGAAIYSEGAVDMNLGGTFFQGNRAYFGGSGGALFVNGGNVTSAASFYRNSGDYGGGAYFENATVNFTSGGASENLADEQGGGLYILDSTVTLRNFSLHSNSSTLGGAISLLTSTLNYQNSGMYGNTAFSNGGAIRADAGSTFTITNSLFEENDADEGKVFHLIDTVGEMYNSTISYNSSTNATANLLFLNEAELSYANNIFEDNSINDALDCGFATGGNYISLGTNLFTGDGIDCGAIGTDLVNTSADFLTLDSGGVSNSYFRSLNPGSPAIDAANATYAPADDQEDTVRPFGLADDIGSIEYVDVSGPALVEVTPVPDPTTDTTPSYTFSSDEPATIFFLGSCTSVTSAIVAGNNTITFEELPLGTYSDCEIYADDQYANQGFLTVTAFTIQAPAPPPPSSGGGGSSGGDTTPPLVFNVQATAITTSTALITWQTFESSTSAVEFGLSASYTGGTISDGAFVTNHQILLTGLLPGTLYHIRASSRDAAFNQALSGDSVFTTLSVPVVTPPPEPTPPPVVEPPLEEPEEIPEVPPTPEEPPAEPIGPPAPTPTPTPPPEVPPEPSSPTRPSEPSSPTPEEIVVGISPQFFGEDSAPLSPDSAGEFQAPPGSMIRVVVPVSDVNGTPESATVSFNGSTYQLTRSADGTSYEGTFPMSDSGRSSATVSMTFTDRGAAISRFQFVSQAIPVPVEAPTTLARPVVPPSPIPPVIAQESFLTRAVAFFQDPEVKEVTEDAVAPAILGLAFVNVVVAVPLANSLAFLQYLFTQPVLLISRRRKNKWGVLYNSLTKQPVDLAIIRLIQHERNIVVQTMVSDKFGRYAFSPQPGTYRLEVVKTGYVFPTQHLKDASQDVEFVELYHGSVITVPAGGVVAMNIPVDPLVAEEPPKQILFKRALRGFQQQVALLSVIGATITMIIVPSLQIALLTLAQVGVYLLFRRLGMPKKAPGWGKVFDAQTGKAVDRAIVRIFDKKFNKLLETQVTSANGTYGFFVRRNIYAVTAEKPGYAKFISPDIDLSNKDEAIVDQNVALKKAI